MNRSALRLLLIIGVVLVLVAGAAAAFVWWKISGLKETLVRDLSNKLGAHVEITSLDFDLWKGELHAAGISLTNQRESAPWQKGEISQATIKFHLTDLMSPTLPLTVEVSSWNVVLVPSTSASSSTTAPASTATSNETGPGSAPGKNRVQVTQLSAQDGSAEIDGSDGKKTFIRGISFEASNNGAGTWTTDLQATSITAGTLVTGASSVQIRGDSDKVTFLNLRVACGQGFITGEGEVALDGLHETRATIKATDLPVSMLVATQWQLKLSGLVTGDFSYTGNDQGGSSKGQISMSHAKINLLPWLNKVTSFVGLADITDVELDKATSDFEWKDHTFHLTNIDVRKNDVIRFAGTMDIDPTGQIDGKLKLGLPSTVTSKWPDLQDKLFSVQLEDSNWADVHVTGTPDHLQEDLTPRLLAVGLQQGGTLIDSAKQKAADLLNSIIGK